MFKQAVKYYLIFLCVVNVIFAQSTLNNINNLVGDFNSTQNKKVTGIQLLLNYNEESLLTKQDKSLVSRLTDINKSNAEEVRKIELEIFKPTPNILPEIKKPEKEEFNIVSSFRENIKFGGFWERHAIINFAPSVNLQPVDFINIYANQNLSCFVPIKEIRKSIYLLCLNSAAILTIDNSVKMLFNKNEWIPNAVGFAAKNLVISLLQNAFINKKVYNHNSYYVAVSVRF